MKSGSDIEAQRRLTFFYSVGLYLLALAIHLPHAGHQDGRTFLRIARESEWNNWWDWPAVWCSVKVILFATGMVLLMSACGLGMEMFKRRLAAKVFYALAGIFIFGFWAGAYLFIKALF